MLLCGVGMTGGRGETDGERHVAYLGNLLLPMMPVATPSFQCFSGAALLFTLCLRRTYVLGWWWVEILLIERSLLAAMFRWKTLLAWIENGRVRVHMLSTFLCGGGVSLDCCFILKSFFISRFLEGCV